ncbi:MAG: adenylosuccinate synthase [Deltaproteobacteria bacterium]|nr:adenylosuccinate synthase [Deltaproteobacteria bacterium]
MVVVVGAQWGDVGKGKVVDILSVNARVIVRFQGGNNAGHTLVVGGEKTILHHIPSGVLHPDKLCAIGPGVVIDPEVLLSEIDALRARGFLKDPGALRISSNAHVIMPYHRALDLAREQARGKGKIGTTGRGIGPCYEDKMGRSGIRLNDLFEAKTLREKIDRALPEKNILLSKLYGQEEMKSDEIAARHAAFGERLRPFADDVSELIARESKADHSILFEGAQGVLLDLDHGTYPFVTSSNTVAGGACTGAGVGPTRIDSVVGITKAYATRVGSGPFPTELDDVVGKRLQERGKEFGSTTGRARRCGWVDAVALRYAVRVSGIQGFVVNKLDVLSGINPVKIATAYRRDGDIVKEFPSTPRELAACDPVYEEMEGWSEDVRKARKMSELPAAARRYLDRISELSETGILMVSVGPGREETIRIKNPFD